MMGLYSYPLLAVGWCLHAGFVIASIVGVILFIVWAMKLKPDQLKKWVMWLLIVGTIGGLVTAQFSFMGWRSMMGGAGYTNSDGTWNNMMNWDGKNQSWNMMNFGNKDDVKTGTTK